MLCFENVPRDEIRVVLLNLDLVEDRMATSFDLVEALLERVEATANEPNVIAAITPGSAPSPEEIGCAHVVEFIERGASILQQAVLATFRSQAIELEIYGPQIADEVIESLPRLPEFIPEHFVVMGVCYVVQGITLVLRELHLRCFLKDSEGDLGVSLAGAGRHDPLDHAERHRLVRKDRHFLTLGYRLRAQTDDALA